MERMASRRLLYACFALMAMGMLMQWFLHAGVLMKGDVCFHLNRILGIASGLAAGDFPVYVHGFQAQGFGTLDGALYPGDLLYLPALLVCRGASIATAWGAYWVLAVCLGFLATWRGYALMSGRAFLGLVAALLFSGSAFQLFNLGGSVGAYVATAFLPYVVGAFLALVRRAEGARYWAELVFAFFIVAGAHVISVLFCLMFLPVGLFWALRRRRLDRARRRALLLAAFFSLALSLFRIVPFAYFYTRVDFHIRHALMPSLSSLTSPLADLAATQFWWGWPLLVLLLAACLSRALRRRRAFLVTAASAVLVTAGIWSEFPWQAIERIPPLGSVLPLFQFPMRLLALALVPLAYFLARTLVALVRRLPLPGVTLRAVCSRRAREISLLLALLSLGYGLHAAGNVDFTMGGMRVTWHPVYHQLAPGEVPTLGMLVQPDYLYADITPDALFASGEVPQPGEVRALSGDITLRSFRKVGTRLTFTYASTAGAEVMVPLFYYPGYEARIDGTVTAVREGAHHVLTLALPAGEHTVFVCYSAPLSFRVSNCISLLALVLFCRVLWRQWRRRRDSIA